MLRIAICDDQKESREQVSALVSEWPDKPKVLSVTCFPHGDALLRAHEATPFDIILLDMVMPVLSGIDIAKELREQDKSVKIVFLTFSPEYAVDSYTVKASDYLLKPIDAERLFSCLNELCRQIRQASPDMVIRSASATYRVELDSIEYIEAQNKHVLFVLSDGRQILALDPMYSFEDKLLLTDGFFRCHRSYIANIYHIDTYTSKEVTMRSGCRIPISRTCRKEFEAAYFSAFFRKIGEAE